MPADSVHAVRYTGQFEMVWLRDDEKVRSAGDGSGAAVIVSPRGERRVDIGDEIEISTSDAADRLLDGIMVALQEFDTATLRAIADWRDSISKDGWMQRLIREYVEVWR